MERFETNSETTDMSHGYSSGESSPVSVGGKMHESQTWGEDSLNLSMSTLNQVDQTVQTSDASSNAATPTNKHIRDPRDIAREIFVGDLSFFCRDHHLVDLFSRFGPVERARIRLGENKRHSLMFGFIRMKFPEHAALASQELNNYLFMGRTMRVQLCNSDGVPSAYEPKFGFQIHVSFISFETVSYNVFYLYSLKNVSYSFHCLLLRFQFMLLKKL